MRAVQYDRFGGPDVLSTVDLRRPEPRSTEVLVRVHAAGVNPADWRTRSGAGLAGPADLPIVPGWDVSGVVEAVAPGVTRFRRGDQVFGMPNFPRPAGAYAEYVTAPARHLARKPQGLDHVHAAALPVAGLTAWQTLFDTARVGPGRRALVRGAAGGVGHLAVQIAKLRGAYVLGSSGADRHDFLRSLGADEAVDDRREDFLTLVREVDVVLDLVVDEESVVTSQELLSPGGLLIAIGELDYPQVPKATTMLVEPDYAELENLAGLAEEGHLRVEVEAVFPLEEAAAAHEAGERGGRRGKLVLEVW